MANRVVLGAFDGTYVLRSSLPGFNVLSTGLSSEQLSFDSRWSDIGKEFMSGVAVSDRKGAFPYGVEVMFGTTFPTPPVVIVRYQETSGVWAGPTFEGFGETADDNGVLIVSADRFRYIRIFGPSTTNLYYTVYYNFFS